jgi:hypothetical protein
MRRATPPSGFSIATVSSNITDAEMFSRCYYFEGRPAQNFNSSRHATRLWPPKLEADFSAIILISPDDATLILP